MAVVTVAIEVDPSATVEYVPAIEAEDRVQIERVELIVYVIVNPVRTLRQLLPETLEA